MSDTPTRYAVMLLQERLDTAKEVWLEVGYGEQEPDRESIRVVIDRVPYGGLPHGDTLTICLLRQSTLS
jgi:hypothetical protein